MKVSASTTPAMSLIGCRSSSAATRGITFLPIAVAAASRCEYDGASDTSSAASGSASAWSSAGASATSTFATPGSFAAAVTAAADSVPATSACTSPSFCAAATALRDGCLMAPPAWSSRTSDVMGIAPGSDDFGFRAQLGDQFGDRADLLAGLALRRFGDAEHDEPRRRIDAEIGRLERLDRLLAGLHDVGQRGIARLIEPQVGGDDGGQRQRQRLQSAIDFAGHGDRVALDGHLAGEGALRPAEQGGEHLAGGIHVVVDRLLAQDEQPGLL